jgi:membrane-bound lytic murein transglycosylase B
MHCLLTKRIRPARRFPILACLAAVSAAVALAAGAGPVHAAPPGSTSKAQNEADAAGFQIGYDQRPEVQRFIDQMVQKHGFVRTQLIETFKRARYNDTVSRLINPQAPSRPKVWTEYRGRFIEPIRINAGVQFWRQHSDDLDRAARTYGVPPDVIVGILGVETIYGRNTGSFRVLDALTTLSFDYPDKSKDRSPFFQEQLEDFLVMARDNNADVLAQRGSYAGAIGMPQFMPSSFIYAVDFDGDGTIDLTGSGSDAIGSVANYLAQQGWEKNSPVLLYATLTPNPASAITLDALAAAGPEPTLDASQLRDAGLNFDMPLDNTSKVALIDLPEGDAPTDYVVGFKNFFVLTRYNRSYFYALAVLELGRAIRTQLNATPAPTLAPSTSLSQ